ncbi:MAG: hypothetical protein GY763_10890 [Gammaproteobacteria bacterium]|nr:hypothetical protein [Gammaproteobacteria bacterium]
MSDSEYNDIVEFDIALRVMEVHFNEMTFKDSVMVDAVYDTIEQAIAESGQSKWFFLVNYKNCRIYETAWIRYAQRGKSLNIAHSMGSVRFAVHEALGQTIENSAKKQNFDPNLFGSREDALAEIERMRKAQGI